MLTEITKIGSRKCIHIDALESIYSRLQGLPAKRKTLFYLKDAVEFLYPAISDALGKNYTKEDIFTVLEDSGLKIDQGTWEYVWSIVRANKNISNRNKLPVKHTSKKQEKSLPQVQKTQAETNSRVKNQSPSDIKESQISVGNENETQNKSVSATIQNGNFQSHSSAYFEVKPDTEDL
jgi:hypothetical protein